MFKPKIRSGKMIFNIKPLSDSSEDKVTGFQDLELSDISLFIDDATPGVPSCLPNCRYADLRGLDMSGQNLYSDFAEADFSLKGTTRTNLTGAVLAGVYLEKANLTDADLTNANLGGAIYDPTTIWPTADFWYNTTCPDGTNSNDPGNATCGL